MDTSIGRPVDTMSQLSSRGLAEALYLESMKTASRRIPQTESIAHEGNLETMKHNEPSILENACNLELMDVLMKRVSVRRFAREDTSQAILTTFLRVAYEADIAEWPQEHLQRRALQFFLLENTKDGQKALYEYHHTDGSLNLIKAISRSSTLPSLYVDTCFQDAPTAIWIVGNLAEAIGAHGSYGHRQLLFRSGAAANRLWLTAISLGIAGTISAGLLPRSARQVLNFDGWRRLALCAFLAGVPANG
jgi:Nitroreductase family